MWGLPQLKAAGGVIRMQVPEPPAPRPRPKLVYSVNRDERGEP